MPSERLLFAVFFLVCASAYAGGPSADGGKIATAAMNKGGLHLEVEQAPLTQVLEIIENQTSVRLHVAPGFEQLVTANCAGTTLEVLKCVLGKEANFIYRYADKASAKHPTSLLKEVWVLKPAPSGRRLPQHNDSDIICEAAEDLDAPVGSEQEEVEKLSALARSSNPAQREEALSRLALAGEDNDEDIRKVLAESLRDQNPKVRAQAVSGLARRDTPEKGEVLREALHDHDVEVRLMAVSNAGEDVALLKAALHDTDRVVRDLANMKLEQISQMNVPQPQ